MLILRMAVVDGVIEMLKENRMAIKTGDLTGREGWLDKKGRLAERSTVTCSISVDIISIIGAVFLDAFSHLYKRVCPSVGPSVGRSVTHELNF